MERKVVNVACAIILHEGKILVAQRGEQMSLPLKWEFPGGKMKDGESAESCIVREILEELEIDIEVIVRLNDSMFNYETISVNLIPFICNYRAGEIRLIEHKEVKWLLSSDMLA
jgi:8-oxo-dGTP diphosphatase